MLYTGGIHQKLTFFTNSNPQNFFLFLNKLKYFNLNIMVLLYSKQIYKKIMAHLIITIFCTLCVFFNTVYFCILITVFIFAFCLYFCILCVFLHTVCIFSYCVFFAYCVNFCILCVFLHTVCIFACCVYFCILCVFLHTVCIFA